ncbi:diguanylate cyclase (GGDEF) domain-containing protein [Pseudobutyrivibrio sp. C4]|nr:diguanylate cyclase (GGDEF) domain-containing protein [Pseudobutyrivibrio sp. C4]
MVEAESWVILNFFTSFLLILLLIFQNQISRLQKGRKYSAILVCTLILLLSETIGRIGEMYPDKYLFLGYIGYFLIFLLDPFDILYALYYLDCWMDDEDLKHRRPIRYCFELFAVLNMVFVSISALFGLKWFFYFENGIYYRGPFFLIRAGFMLLFIFMLLVYALVFNKHIMSEYKAAVLFLPALSLIGALLQIFIANIDCTYAGISLGCLIVFFYYQSRDVNIDYLTGVLNRRGLDIKMQDMVKSSISSGKDFTAIMMDVDNFKDINDSMGHEEGDKAIKIIADILVDTFGRAATIGRFGGDEFCVITDELDMKQINEKIDEVRDYVAKQSARNNWPQGVDISCGFQSYSHNSSLTAEQFQELIDKLMYVEKQAHHQLS